MDELKQRPELADDFSPPSSEDWRAAAEKLLKGAPFEKILQTRLPEGFTLDPIYSESDIQELEQVKAPPGFFPYSRGSTVAGYQGQPWNIAQRVDGVDPHKAGATPASDVDRGLDTVVVIPDRAAEMGLDPDQASSADVGTDGISVCCAQDVKALCAGADPTSWRLEGGCGALLLAPYFLQEMKHTRLDIALDPHSALARDGHLAIPLDAHYDWMAEEIKHDRLGLVCSAGGGVWHEAGASVVQRLAFTIASAVEYLRALTERGIAFDQAVSHMELSFRTGTVFLMEIACFRAARILWANIARAWEGKTETIRLQASTARRDKTRYDPYVNMLRATTECMSAIAGGADGIRVDAFDGEFRPSNTFSRRIARNTQIILRDESHMDQVIDPAGGSYTVEYLTDRLAELSWELFQKVEAEGGFTEALKKGTLQEMTRQTAKNLEMRVQQRREVIVGVNMFADPVAKPVEIPDLEESRIARREECGRLRPKKEFQFDPRNISISMETIAAGGATIGQIAALMRAHFCDPCKVEPVLPVRLAEPFENLRDAVRAMIPVPKIFLAGVGTLRDYKARADFSAGFFAPGGFDILSPKGHDDWRDAVDEALDSGADAVVLCSTDQKYPEFVVEATQALKEKNPAVQVVLAGYPKEHVAAFEAAGVDMFIHLKANAFELLARLAKHLGAKQ